MGVDSVDHGDALCGREGAIDVGDEAGFDAVEGASFFAAGGKAFNDGFEGDGGSKARGEEEFLVGDVGGGLLFADADDGIVVVFGCVERGDGGSEDGYELIEGGEGVEFFGRFGVVKGEREVVALGELEGEFWIHGPTFDVEVELRFGKSLDEGIEIGHGGLEGVEGLGFGNVMMPSGRPRRCGRRWCRSGGWRFRLG